MNLNLKTTLLVATALVAVGAVVVPVAAQAGDSANLVIDGGAPAAVPPGAGEVLQIQPGQTNAVWDADDGLGADDASIEFVGGVGDASLVIQNSIDANHVSVGDIYVTDGEYSSTIILDAGEGIGVAGLIVKGNVTNNDVGSDNNVIFVLDDNGGNATLSFEFEDAEINASVVAGGDGEGRVDFYESAVFNGNIGEDGTSVGVLAGGDTGKTVVINGDVYAGTIYARGEYQEDMDGAPLGGMLLFGGHVTGNIELSEADGLGSAVGFGAQEGVTTAVNLTVDGDITTIADGKGVIAVMSNDGQNTTVTFTGSIGDGVNAVGLMGVESTSHAIFAGTGATLYIDELMFVDEGRPNSAQVTFADGVDFVGNISAESGDGAGILNFEGDTTLTGNVAGVLEINGGDEVGKRVIFDGDVDAGAVNVTGAGTIRFSNGTVNADLISIAEDGALEIDSFANVTASEAIENGGLISIMGDGELNADINNSDHVYISLGGVLNGNIDNDVDADTRVTLQGGTINGNIANADDIVFAGQDGALVNGNITGRADIDVDMTGTIRGNVSAGVVEIATLKTLTFDADGESIEIDVRDGVLLEGSSIVEFDTGVGGEIAFSGDIEAGVSGQGSVVTTGAGKVTFDGDIGDVALLEVGSDEVVARGDIHANAIEIGNNRSLTLEGSGVTVSSAISGAGAGNGALIVADGADVTFESVIGGLAIETMEVAGTARVSNNITTDGAFVLDGGTLNISADGGVVTISELSGDIDLNGTVDISGADDVAAGDVSFDAQGDLLIDGTFETALEKAGALTVLNAGGDVLVGTRANTTLTVGNQIVLGNDLTLGAAGRTVTILAGGSDNFNPLDGDVLIDADGNVVTVVADAVGRFGLSSSVAGAYESGQTVIFIDNADAASAFDVAVVDGRIVFVSNGLLTMDSSATDEDTVAALVSFNDAKQVFGNKSNANAANVLINNDPAELSSDLREVRGKIIAASSTSEAEAIASSLIPSVSASVAQTTVQTSVQSVGVSNDRMASLRTGSETGVAAGNISSGLQVWGQGFGRVAEQDRRGGVDGYDVNTYGLAVGLDTANTLASATVGVAFSYANSEVDHNNTNRTKAEIDSYQVSLYGSVDLSSHTYLSGTLGYAWNEIEQARHNVGGAGGPTAIGETQSNQWIAYTELGHTFEMTDRTLFTPHVMAHYQHLDVDGYAERGAGGLGQNVRGYNHDVLELGVGAELAWDLRNSDGSRVRPALNAGYRHDVINDDVATTSNFIGGGATFDTDGLKPAAGTVNVGAAMTWDMQSNWSLTADYDYEIKSDYDAHSGSVRAGYKF